MQKANIFNIQHFPVHDGPDQKCCFWGCGADGAIIRNLSILKRNIILS